MGISHKYTAKQNTKEKGREWGEEERGRKGRGNEGRENRWRKKH